MEERSLRAHVIDLIGSFLYQEKFPTYSYLQEGILELIDAISSYREEGEELHPEIFVTDDINVVLRTLPFCKKVEIATAKPTVQEFSRALRLCAPLSKNGWVIYIHVSENELKYGLVSSEISELSLSFRQQVLGELGENREGDSIAYLQNVGNRTVLLEGSETNALIRLTLSREEQTVGGELNALCTAITCDIESQHKEIAQSYFEKLIGHALIVGHGNLIGVVEDNEQKIATLRQRHPDGIYLIEPIDMLELLSDSEEQKTREASTSNRLFTSLVQSMLNHDGMSVFTTTGRVLGYHIFVTPQGDEEKGLVGGARARAFEIMTRSGCFSCCFYKSHDGSEKIWSESDGE